MQSHIPNEECKRASIISTKFFELIPKESPRAPRYMLSSAAVLLTHEHHSSIHRLVARMNFASATTLLRPMLDAVTTAIWAVYVPQPSVVVDILHGRASLPRPSAMISAIERRAELKGETGLRELMADKGRMFHKLTHGDMEQLWRRYNASGTTYRLEENRLTVELSSLLLLWGGTVLLVYEDSAPLQQFLERESNYVVKQLREFTGEDLFDWSGWRPMPKPLIATGPDIVQTRG